MHNWQENEIRELLNVRGLEAIRHQMTGTVKDSVVYNRMTKLLAERGVYRTHMQVISKLKALRKQYNKFHQQKVRFGNVDWPFYEQCSRVFGFVPAGNPVKRQRSPSPPPPPRVITPPPPSTPSPPPPPPPTISSSDEHQEVVVGLWDDVDVDEQELSKHLVEQEEEDEEEEEQYIPSEQLQPIITNHDPGRPWRRPSRQPGGTIPRKRRKTTVMDQVSALVTATVAQLREMDAAMQAQEDARLQRSMDHEREMQDNLLSHLAAMNERMSRENHQRQLELVDRIMSRFPSSSEPSGQ